MMASSRWDDDDELFADLAQALRHDTAAEPELRRMAEGALTWQTVDGEIAALSYDSLHDRGLTARARSGTLRRTVVFEHSTLRIEVELTADGLVGQLMPMGPRLLTLEGVDGLIQETDTDDIGNFLFDAPINSPVRLRCRTGDVEISTDWIGL